jgi:hypothetical protein
MNSFFRELKQRKVYRVALAYALVAWLVTQILYHGPSASPLTPALLRLDPIWDPLHNDPAFQKLCEEKL